MFNARANFYSFLSSIKVEEDVYQYLSRPRQVATVNDTANTGKHHRQGKRCPSPATHSIHMSLYPVNSMPDPPPNPQFVATGVHLSVAYSFEEPCS